MSEVEMHMFMGKCVGEMSRNELIRFIDYLATEVQNAQSRAIADRNLLYGTPREAPRSPWWRNWFRA